jgi:hypothetical protein
VQSELATAVPAEPAADIPTGVDADGNFYRGNPNAAVKLVEWSDFECPYCGRHATETGPLLDEAYIATGKVQHIFRNFPLSFHPNAMPSALAAFCAGQQDPALFWEMHDWLFTNQSVWSSGDDAPASFREQALAAGAEAASMTPALHRRRRHAIDRDLTGRHAARDRRTPASTSTTVPGGAYPFEAFQDATPRPSRVFHAAHANSPARRRRYDADLSAPDDL